MVSALLSRCLILILGTLYPAYRSYKAIKNKDVKEHVKWMMYWIVFALFTTLETFLDIFFSWFPFYYEIKILFILWVLSPATRGSSLLYKKVVHPLLIAREKEIDELIEKTKQQGYTTFLQLFQSGFQYASHLFLHSAVKGQSLLGSQLKKSLSLNDVYDEDVNGAPTPAPTSDAQLYLKGGGINKKAAHETIEEEEEHSAVSGRTFRAPKSTFTTTVAAAANIRDYEIIDDHDLENRRPASAAAAAAAAKRRSSSKQMTNLTSSVSNYKSNEVSHFGTITRAKISKTKLVSTSNPAHITAQLNINNKHHSNYEHYDND